MSSSFLRSGGSVDTVTMVTKPFSQAKPRGRESRTALFNLQFGGMEEAETDGLKTKLIENQPYDESLEVNDSEEVASVYTPTPRRPGTAKQLSGKVRGMADLAISSEDEESTKSEKKKKPGKLGHVRGARTQGLTDDEDTEDTEGDDDDDEDDDDDDDDDDEEGHGTSNEGYNPADYEHLPVTAEIKELFQYITRYTPQVVELDYKLKPFIPDFIPAVGDIDAYLKVPRPDGKPDNLGLLTLDEPSTRQSDPTVMALWLSENSKQHSVTQQIKVKTLENAERNSKAIDAWIESISELHRSKPPATVHYTRSMPDIDTLMQEWPSEFEELLGKISLPAADIDCDLPSYIDMICGILDIPVYKSRIQSLHVLFSLYSAFKNSQHFKDLAEGKKDRSSSGNSIPPNGETDTMNLN
ncbi:LOW QUALITY PROTEIN: intraflagellar transport protein 46 homolog [Xenopus laevis]|uniref:Intraflagellar transport protein 46 homolog n=2 Tax=Xenopus laevis TaxID=8355 RepID=A0A8J0TYI2_XENLA|nr:LOW QUALITY PROTEIN: intraflagellar transport protein 46 homolog [Xenopus laevis]